MVGAFVALTVVGTFLLAWLLRDDPQQEAAPTSSNGQQEVSEGADPASGDQVNPMDPSSAPPSPTTPTPSSSPSPSPTASPVAIPPGAKLCSTDGADQVASAYAANPSTSCPFAGSVRAAYRQKGSPTTPTSITARSSVTKKDYQLSCNGGRPITCTTTSGASVVLGPPPAR